MLLKFRAAVSRAISSIRPLFTKAKTEECRIAVLGASLSAQTVNHKSGELTGYVEAFRRSFCKRLGVNPENIVQFAYGGNRLSDAGIIRLEDVIKFRPTICLIEPIVEDTSRGRDATDIEVEYVLRRLIEESILPVVFCVPLPLSLKVTSSERYKRCLTVCEKMGVPIKEVDLSPAVSRGLTFNGLHTVRETAEFLASELWNFLSGIDINKALKGLRYTKSIEPLLSIERIAQEMNNAWESVQIDFNAESDGHLILIQKQNIGPFSPVLEVTVKDELNRMVQTSQVSVWDRFCYYQRSSYVTLCDVSLKKNNGSIVVQMSESATPDYQSCPKLKGKLPAIDQLRLDPIGPFFVISTCKIQLTAFDIK